MTRKSTNTRKQQADKHASLRKDRALAVVNRRKVAQVHAASLRLLDGGQ